MKCDKCGSENTITGELRTDNGSLFGTRNVYFVTRKPYKTIPLSAVACKDCGNIIDIILDNPEKL